MAGHRLLDAVDALVDDPQRLRSTLEATSGWVQRLAEAVPAVAPTARRGGRNGVEHIEIDDG